MATYQTLTLSPNWDAQESYPDHTFEIQLGDSYTVNSVSTNQPTRAEWSIKRNGLTKEEADELVEQFELWGGVTPFYWQPHPAVQKKLYFCEKWTVTPLGFTHYEFSATLIEDIRGECIALGALIDPDDIDNKLSNASGFLTSFTGSSGNYLINSGNNLVVRSLHTHAEQIPSTAGTLYDQLTLALGCIATYEYTELSIWLTRAIAYGQAIIDSYYNSDPEDGVYLPHWLYDIKGDNRLEELYPTAGTLSAGSVNAPFTYIPMLWELYTKLAEHDSSEPQWETLADSTKADFIILSGFTKQTTIYRKSTGSPTEYPGTETGGGTASRVSGGTLDQFVGVTGSSNLVIQNISTEIAVTSTTTFSVQASSSLSSRIIEFYVSTNTDDTSAANLYRQFWQLGSSNTINSRTIASYELFKFDNLLWYYESGLSSGSDFYETQSIAYNGNTFDNVVLRLEDFATLNINTANSDRNPFKFFIKVATTSAIIRLQDASGRLWDYTVPMGDWVLLSPTWSSFVWSSANGYAQGGIQPDTNANILNVQISVTPGSFVYLWWVGKTAPEAFPAPSYIYRAGILHKGITSRTLYAGDILVNNSPTDTLFNTPGSVPFSRKVTSGVSGDIIGLPHSSYQNPWIWKQWSETARLNNTISFLEAAKTNYGSSIGETGPFAPLYNWSDPINQLSGTVNEFRFVSNDGLSTSGQYQVQVLLYLAKAWYIDRSNNRLKNLVMGWLQWADQIYATRSGSLPPISFPSTGIAIAGHNSGVQAIIGEAALWANLSGGDPAITFRWINRTLEYLDTEFVIPGSAMSGSWSFSQATFASTLKEYYSWWHGACIRFYSNLVANKPQITYPPCSEPLSITTTEPPPTICCGATVIPCGLGTLYNSFTMPKASSFTFCRMDMIINQESSGVEFLVPKSATQWIAIGSNGELNL